MKIFIADYLPLANKGEEEILRGLESLYNKTGKERISFSVFGDVTNIQRIGNVTIFPKSICYPPYKTRGKVKVVADILKAGLNVLGFYPYKKEIKKNKGLVDSLKSADVILIGHDGFFNLRCAMLGNYLHSSGLHYAILGAGFNRPSKNISWVIDKVYKECFDHADFVILREQTAYKYVKDISKNNIVELYPDPAFFCPSDQYDEERVKTVVSTYGIERESVLKIGLTICEDSISFSRAFFGKNNRLELHREFIAKLIESISNKYRCSFFFLPHCIKEGKGNDLVIAEDVVSRLPKTVDCKIINEDLPVLDLKYLISKMDLVIGERTHSIINSIATSTSFVSLTCSADFRTHDIVGNGCKLPQQIYDLDNPNENELFKLVDKTISEKESLERTLEDLCKSYNSMKLKLQEII